MTNLILRTRLQMLRRNLEDVQLVVESIDNGQTMRADLQRLRSILTERPDKRLMQNKIKRARALAKNVGEALRDGREQDATDDMDSVIKLLDEIADEGSESGAGAQVGSAEPTYDLQEVLASIERRRLLLTGEGPQVLQASLVNSAKEASEMIGGGEPTWASYAEHLPKVQEIFCEYLDFLNGLALRDSGYDRGISRIADEIGRRHGTYDQFTWKSLAIPARQEALDATIASMIRIGFPEWSIWALPLAAHELGFVFVKHVSKLKDFASRSLPDEVLCKQRAVLVADAFATYVMGCAYACAALLMRLDPADPGLTRARAETILGVLERMAEKSTEAPYQKTAQRLRTEWDDAVLKLGDQQSEPVPVATDEIFALVRGVLNRRDMPPDAWPEVAEWAATWARRESVDRERIAGDIELRYVLNAAWLCRLPIDDPGHHQFIADEAEQLWYWFESQGWESPGALGRGGGMPPPRPGPGPSGGTRFTGGPRGGVQ